MRGAARRSVAIFLGFMVSVYLLESSIGSLGDVDLWARKYGEDYAVRQEARHKRALSIADNEYLDAPPSSPINVTIRKCCNESQILNRLLECVPGNLTAGQFFPERMVVDKDFYRLNGNFTVLYNQIASCKDDEKVILTKESSKSHLLTHPSSTLVRLKDDKILFNYSSHYCLDYLDPDTFMLLLCPCQQHLCIQKCCPHDEYYSITKQQCRKQEHLLPFLNLTINTIYYLVNKPLDCGGQPDSLIKEFNDSRQVLVQNNGNLIHRVEGKISVTGVKSYCLDVFSEGNFAQTNGFYCQSSKSRRRLNKCCKKGEMLNQRFQCQKGPEGTRHPKLKASDISDKFESFGYGGFRTSGEGLEIHLRAGDYVLYVNNKRVQTLSTSDVMTLYSSEAFCLDHYLPKFSGYALIFNPCKQQLCLQKCCPYGSIFNLSDNKCSKSSDDLAKALELIVLDGATNQSSDYFLLESDHHGCCFSTLLHPDLLEGSRLLLQKGGQLPKGFIGRSIPSREYCVDLFLDQGLLGVNGFFCENRSIVRSKDHDLSHICDAEKNLPNAGGVWRASFAVVLIIVALMFQLGLRTE